MQSECVNWYLDHGVDIFFRNPGNHQQQNPNFNHTKKEEGDRRIQLYIYP